MTESPNMVIGTYKMPSFEVMESVVHCCFENNIAAFDTAPSYGTESMLGKAIQENCNGHNFFCSDKIDAIQMYEGKIKEHVEGRLQMMSLDSFDLLLIHWPLPQYLERTWQQMQELKDEGKIKKIGICNVRVRHLEKFAKENIVPDYIQIERHPLNTCDEELAYCKDNHIKVMAYSPLGQMLPKIKTSSVLNELAKKYSKNVGQIILRWHIDSGVIPVFGTTKPKRLKENIDIRDFKLSQDEIASINGMNENLKIFLESWGCPKF